MLQVTRVIAPILLLAVTVLAATAQNQQAPTLHTNEAFVDETLRSSTLAIGDPKAVFIYILANLPTRVKVYPTENFYYFRFTHNGVPYAGNIRLDPNDRDAGKVHFVYFQQMTAWRQEGSEGHALFDAASGVIVERIEPLAYRVSYGQTAVVFALNDLSGVKMPAAQIGPREQYLGLIFDEAAIRFFLVFNSKLKLFHYVLDETSGVADELYRSKRTDRILIGRRTGFAFYRDHRLDRKILIGAYELNSLVNNYYDGPFDQLPENFIVGEELREAMIASDPVVKGQIDRLGNYTDGGGRFVIHPYMLYTTERDLYRIDRCAVRRKRSPEYYRCFVVPATGAPSPSRRKKRP